MRPLTEPFSLEWSEAWATGAQGAAGMGPAESCCRRPPAPRGPCAEHVVSVQPLPLSGPEPRA